MNIKKISKQKGLIGKNPQQMLFAEEVPTIKNLYPPDSKRERIENKLKNLIHEELKLGSVVSYVGNRNVPFLEKEPGKLGKENLKIIECVYNALIKDKKMQKQIERIKEHKWLNGYKARRKDYNINKKRVPTSGFFLLGY
jgi:hypothetical protein